MCRLLEITNGSWISLFCLFLLIFLNPQAAVDTEADDLKEIKSIFFFWVFLGTDEREDSARTGFVFLSGPVTIPREKTGLICRIAPRGYPAKGRGQP